MARLTSPHPTLPRWRHRRGVEVSEDRMNVFISDPCPIASARALADRHVVKMTLETAQILSTNLDLGYRPTHRGHPCVAGCSDVGYLAWVIAHGLALSDEYTHRYGRRHGSTDVIERAALLRPGGAPEPSASWPCCVPDEHRSLGLAEAYRATLRAKYVAWGPMARWTRREPPAWL